VSDVEQIGELKEFSIEHVSSHFRSLSVMMSRIRKKVMTMIVITTSRRPTFVLAVSTNLMSIAGT